MILLKEATLGEIASILLRKYERVLSAVIHEQSTSVSGDLSDLHAEVDDYVDRINELLREEKQDAKEG